MSPAVAIKPAVAVSAEKIALANLIEEELRQVKGAYAFLYGRLVQADQRKLAEVLSEDGYLYDSHEILGLAETVENGLARLDRIVDPGKYADVVEAQP